MSHARAATLRRTCRAVDLLMLTTLPPPGLASPPPAGGATALIAASAHSMGDWYGFKLVLTVFFGSLAMLVVALAINNLPRRRRYPTYWLGA